MEARGTKATLARNLHVTSKRIHVYLHFFFAVAPLSGIIAFSQWSSKVALMMGVR
jgi:hypothetical protein